MQVTALAEGEREPPASAAEMAEHDEEKALSVSYLTL
jgi:hypothetical protein